MYRTYRLTSEAGTFEGPYSVFDLMELAKKRLVLPSTYLIDEDGERIPARDLMMLRSAFGDLIPSQNPIETPWKRHQQPTAQYMQRPQISPKSHLNQADLPKYVLGAAVFPVFFSWRHKDFKWVGINVVAMFLGLGIFASIATMYAAPRMAVSSELYQSAGEAEIAFEKWNKAAVWSLLFSLIVIAYLMWMKI